MSTEPIYISFDTKGAAIPAHVDYPVLAGHHPGRAQHGALLPPLALGSTQSPGSCLTLGQDLQPGQVGRLVT